MVKLPPNSIHPSLVKRAILEWISNTKKPETRSKRITETVELAAKNIRASQWRQRSNKSLYGDTKLNYSFSTYNE